MKILEGRPALLVDDIVSIRCGTGNEACARACHFRPVSPPPSVCEAICHFYALFPSSPVPVAEFTKAGILSSVPDPPTSVPACHGYNHARPRLLSDALQPELAVARSRGDARHDRHPADLPAPPPGPLPALATCSRLSRSKVLIDCGLFQGPETSKALNYGEFPFRPADIDVVLLTHAHIDHSGLLPKLVRQGFAGRIFATRGTIDLCSYMLPDAGGIQESEVEALQSAQCRARARCRVADLHQGRTHSPPRTCSRRLTMSSGSRSNRTSAPEYWNAGHLLGSASIELEFSGEGHAGQPLRILASGDIGPDAKLFQTSPEAPTGFDYVIPEATYGDRERPSITPQSRRESLAAEICQAQTADGALLILSVRGRAHPGANRRSHRVSCNGEGLPTVLIFLDSPLTPRVTPALLRQHASELGPDIDIAANSRSPNLRFTETVSESKAIEKLSAFHIIIAASGMCDAGRIRHHLKRWLWNWKATVLLTGFQARGTLGRFLDDGAKAVRIQGEEIKVAARIRRIDDYSGHADSSEWFAGLRRGGRFTAGCF